MIWVLVCGIVALLVVCSGANGSTEDERMED